MPDTQTVEPLARVKKNAREDLLIQRTEFKGKDLLDVRVFAVDGDDLTPTRKGLALQPATWRQLLPEIQKALAEE